MEGYRESFRVRRFREFCGFPTNGECSSECRAVRQSLLESQAISGGSCTRFKHAICKRVFSQSVSASS